MDNERLKIFLDTSGETYGYSLLSETGEIILQGDGYESEDAVIVELSSWNEALGKVFG